MKPVNEEIRDLFVAHAVNLEGVKNYDVKKILTILKEMEKKIIYRIANEEMTQNARARLEALIKAIDKIITQTSTVVYDELDSQLKLLAIYESEFTVNAVNRALPPAIQFDTIVPPKNALVAAVRARPFQGALLVDWVNEWGLANKSRIAKAIRLGFLEGMTNDQVVTKIRGTAKNKYSDGILEISRRGAEAVVRTAMAHTANYARVLTLKENKKIINQYQWVSTLDSRTSDICRFRDGKLYDIGSGIEPPAHINCRSSIIPVIPSWKELGITGLDAGTRASMNGQVAADLKYNEWLAKQPDDIIEQVLGKTRAKLFKDGSLSIDKFVNNQGVRYTLDELREREEKAFKKAKL